MSLKINTLHIPIILFCILLLLSCQKVELKQPNVIIILTDQWRASALGYNGNEDVKTPNLDEFAAQSVNLPNAVSVSPVCTPFRASLLTGKFPTETGMFLNDLHFPDDETTMAEVLKDEGYQTAFWGKWHLDGHGRKVNVAPKRRQGFEYWKGAECSHNYNRMIYYENDDPTQKIWTGYSPFAIANDVNDYVKNKRQANKPQFMFISLATPHFPHHSAPEEYRRLYQGKDFSIDPNVPKNLYDTVRRELAGYYAHCTATDKAVGDIISQLKEADMYDNSIIIFTSDHGEMMGAHGRYPFRKQLPWNESSNIPFLIHYPAIDNNKGKKLYAGITTPDIMPTLLSFAGVARPEGIQGEDISDLIKTCDPNADRAAMFMNIHPFDINMKDPEYRAVRNKRFTYVVGLDGPLMLFDNQSDPFQLNNLVNSATYAQKQAELHSALQTQLIDIGDFPFRDRSFYLDKFNLILNAGGNNIKYNFKPGEQHVVQTPNSQK
ncbi:sulfatase family protein [Marinoscillum furvescens]|uniref:Arylsulfatase A-like enzyme n=1 Tax=Marinoscillum furvescens DSM 4134 TaxID=1122208 RepID=A0A3D9L430_MARFU|nr:sulfatase [Marinoscillum furvescens]RED98360.1 arylsulfatase A-like enzyme [Marinoscillum furvescens DSM 4134]